MDRLRHLALILTLAVFGLACNEGKTTKKKAVPRRFASVKKTQTRAGVAARAFCEQTFAAGEQKWVEPPERPVPSFPGAPAAKEGWRWINLWASWCGPCIEEMPLLERWHATIVKEGTPMRLELWSVDEEEEDLVGILKRRKFPGILKWLRGADDLVPFLESMGVDKGSAIPIHAFVDPKGYLRCVRVGALAEEGYPQLKTMLAGG